MSVAAGPKHGGFSAGLAVLAFGVAAGACGPDGSDVASSPAATAAATAPSEPAPTEPAPAEPATAADPPSTVPAPAGLAARAELGYPRDLVERGRFNLVMTNDGIEQIVVVGKELDADHYESAPPDERRSILPAGGRPVALQTLFGDVDDCEDGRRVEAAALLTYTIGDDPTRWTSAVPLDDAAVLDGIRAQRCTSRAFNERVTVEFDDVEVDGETFTADLILTHDDTSNELAIEAIVGTVLFGAEARLPADELARVVEVGVERFVLPLVFDVNRCDPHAVAETTEKFGLDLWIAVDGAEAQPVEIPIEPVLDEFEAILDACKRRTEQ